MWLQIKPDTEMPCNLHLEYLTDHHINATFSWFISNVKQFNKGEHMLQLLLKFMEPLSCYYNKVSSNS